MNSSVTATSLWGVSGYLKSSSSESSSSGSESDTPEPKLEDRSRGRLSLTRLMKAHHTESEGSCR